MAERKRSLKTLAIEAGMPRTTLFYRIRIKGMSVEDALRTPPLRAQKKASIYITYNNKTRTLAEWAEETKTPLQTLYMRYYRRWPPEAIITGVNTHPERARHRHAAPKPKDVQDIFASLLPHTHRLLQEASGRKKA